jgi:hypothetical protein
MRRRNVLIVVLLTGGRAFGQNAPPQSLSPDLAKALGTIRAGALRGDLKFLASDLLEGRDSPSRGLDIAAEYIAAQFQIAGLEPGVDGGYFQQAQMISVTPNFVDFALNLSDDSRQLSASRQDVVLGISRQTDIKDAPVFKLDLADDKLMENLMPQELEGKVVITEFNPKLLDRLRAANKILHQAKPTLTVLVDAAGTLVREEPSHRLEAAGETSDDRPQITWSGPAAARFYAALKPGIGGARLNAHIAGPDRKRVTLRNVIGILRGSDPELRATCVMLTAHYDHLGMRPGAGGGDRIYNGANDNGSGTVAVIAAARALAGLNERPRRSVLFVTFFGEEEGLLGSEYYAAHPVWPLDKTVAQLNLEQVGRTDSTEGPQRANATVTGFDYSDLSSYLQRAGASTGIHIYKHPENSDAYFNASDNYSLAQVGVPDATLAVTFGFPDYHAVGDEWQKIDYPNMAKVDRAVALAIYLMAESERPVEWNEANPKAAPFVKARKERLP